MDLSRVRIQAARRGRQVAHRTVRRWRDRPPVVSRSWPPAPPDFVGIGVQRAGTSWWYALIEAHPAVHRLSAAGKELHYFDRFWSGEFGEAEIEGYREMFRRPAGRSCGEWTPRYMFDPWTPALLHRAAPDAKLLVMLRDPLERFRSGLTHSVERGGRIDADTVANAAGRGMYHEQLVGVLAHYRQEQLLVLQYERCRAEPQAMLRRTQAFLGLDEHLPEAAFTRTVNAAAIAKVDVRPGLLDELSSRYQPDMAALAARFPEVDLGLWPSSGGDGNRRPSSSFPR